MLDNFIFDLDGTLIYSFDDIILCLEKTYDDFGFEFKINNKVNLIGPSLREMVKLISNNLNKNQIDLIIERFKKYYDNCDYTKTTLIPGVLEVLEKLKAQEKSIFLATNKRLTPTKNILTKFKILNYFQEILTPDVQDTQLTKKDMLQYLINKYELNKIKTVIIGDTELDLIAAYQTGIKSIAFLQGYGQENVVRKHNPTYYANNFNDILSFI